MNVPVIVGIGEIADRSEDPMASMEPLALMEAAIRAADADAGGGLMERIDSLDIVPEVSWPYANPTGLLCERLGVSPARVLYGEIGGETPVRFLHQAARRIAAGECAVAVVVGAESGYAVARAMKARVRPPWSPPDPNARVIRGADIAPPLAIAHGIFEPVTIYPLYENATAAHWGLTPGEAQRETGELYARFSAVAAANPQSWQRHAQSAEQITTPSADNRYIAWPYTKSMVANPMVNQGAALLLTTAERARAAGIPDARMVHVWTGASAAEPRDFLARAQYHASDAQEIVLDTVKSALDGAGVRLTHTELYSCFPCVPKMARRSLGLAPESVPTVAGGLSFYGAPLSTYMTQAAAIMVRALRGAAGSVGLLYGQGEFVTKHHALVLASRPVPDGISLLPARKCQAEVDARRGAVPALAVDYTGPATLETHTTVYHREGHPLFGAVVARSPDGRRLMARVEGSDAAGLQVLTDFTRSAVGRQGRITAGTLQRWEMA